MRYLLSLVFVCLLLPVAAQERLFTEYQYDEVGNIIQKSQDLSGAAPRVDSVTPSVVRQNQVVNVVIVGEGLRGAQLNNADGNFTLTNIQSSNEQLSFTLAVARDATEGPSQISISTGLGTDFASLEVLTELPRLTISPIPIVIKTGTSLSLAISLSKPDVVNHGLSVSILNPDIASTPTGDLSFATGSIEPDSTIVIDAVSAGRTRINFESATLGDYSYSLTITDSEFSLAPGEQFISYGTQLGINKVFTPPPPDLVDLGPFRAEVRINKLGSVVAENQDRFAYSNQVGLLKGSYVASLSPNAIAAGEVDRIVTINGSGLQSVDDVTILPNTDVTIDQLSVDPSGESVSFEVDVSAGVEFSKRRLLISAAGERVAATDAEADRIYIGGVTPQVNSVSPIYFNRGDIRTVTVRGQNLEAVRGISFDNEENLVFSGPVVNSDGTALTFGLEIVGFARLGSRMLVLNSLLGDSTPLNVNASLITIADRPPLQISPVMAPLVGINKLVADTSDDLVQTNYSNLLGVNRGSLLTKLMPASRSQGSSFTLNLEGLGLDSIVAAEFEPAEGITVGAFNSAPDGQSATLELDIAEDAPPTTRKLKLSNGANFIFAQGANDRFTVTLPRPQLSSIQPLQVEQGSDSINLVLRGELLNNASAVTFEPSAGITVSSVTPNVEGTEVEAVISVNAAAATGPRVVRVTTPGGQTESVAMISNTLTVVEEISQTITPILSATLGVTREFTTVPPVDQTVNVFTAAALGVVKESTPPVEEVNQFTYSSLLGVSRGSVARSVMPTSIAIGSTQQSIEISGVNLDNVTSVRTIPADGVTLNGPAVIAADGSRVTFTADVANDAEQTARRVELLTSTGLIPFIDSANSQLRITGLLPEINSLEPIQQVRGASFLMTIRGINFNGVQSVQATPANGITIGTPTVSADGRSVEVQVVISDTASTEQKVITVTTSAGVTTNAAMPSNTFTVISE